MDITFIDEIRLKAWIKGKHFYKKRLVQIHNGIFRYFSASSSGELRFQADLLDFSIIEQNINKGKPELMLTSKSNAFSPLIVYHDEKETLLHFKQQLEQMMEWEKEKNLIHVKSKKLAEIVQKYSLVNIYHLNNEIKGILEANYFKYKTIFQIGVETNDFDRIKRIDTEILHQEKINTINQYDNTAIKLQINHQVVLINVIGLFASLLILYSLTNEGYLYQIVFVMLLVLGLPFQLKLFIQNNLNRVKDQMNKSIKQSLIIKCNALMSINIFQLLDVLMRVLSFSALSSDYHNMKKEIEDNAYAKFEIYIEAKINQVIVIEKNKSNNTILGIYVLQSNKLQTQTILYSYSFSFEDSTLMAQQNPFQKLMQINHLIKYRHEEAFFSQKESFLFDEEVEFKIEDRDEIELKVDQLFDENLYNNSNTMCHFNNEQSLDYNEIINYQSDNQFEGIMLKEDIVVLLDKELIKLFFLSNNFNINKANKYIKKATQLCDKTIIEIEIELINIGDISFKSKYEVGDIEINGIKYSIISYINLNEDNKIIEHFGYYIWKSEYKTHITSWVMFESIGDEKSKEILLSSMKLFLKETTRIEDNIQEEIDKLVNE